MRTRLENVTGGGSSASSADKAAARNTATVPSDVTSVTVEDVPVLVRGSLAASEGHVVVSIGRALVVLAHDGKRFVADVVDPEANPGASLAIAAGASLHVFHHAANGTLLARVKGDGGWSRVEILAPPDGEEVTPGARGLAAASDAQGRVWVAVVSKADELTLLSNRTGSFVVEHRWRARARPMSYATHPFVDLACDGAGVVIAYLDLQDLKVARFESGAFSEETVREQAGGWVSVAVDEVGTTHLAYMSWAGPKSDIAEYAVRERGAAAWRFETIDKKGNAGYQARLLLLGGHPHVYFGERSTRYSPDRFALSSKATRLASRTERGGGWTAVPCAPGGWALALTTIDGRPVAFAGPNPMDESGWLQVSHAGPPLHPVGEKVAGAPEPTLLLLGGLRMRLLQGEPVYLEHGERFWEITLAGATHTTRIGKVGAKGSSKSATLDSPEAARAAALKLLDKKYSSDFFKEPAVAAAEHKAVTTIMSNMRESAQRSIAADEAASAARQGLPAEVLPVIWDTRGVEGPLLGRLRGVTARGEIRNHTGIGGRIYFKAPDPHFVFRRAVPSPLPDFLTNAERQLVVSKRLAEALADVPDLEPLPVRLVDVAGREVSADYVLLEVKVASQCLESSGGYDATSYYFAAVEAPRPGNAVGDLLPPLSRAQGTLLIACNAAVAAKVAPFSGVRLIPLSELSEPFWPPPESAYQILRAGEATEFALFKSTFDFEEAFETGKPVAAEWPAEATMKMTGAKSYKKIVDFMRGPGAPVISERAKTLLEKLGATEIELLPVNLQDHGGKAVPGRFFVLNVLATRPYVDVDESDVETKYGYLWNAREIVVDEGAFTDRPALFRVPGARYPWVFGRTDVLAAVHQAKLVGLHGIHPFQYAYPTESGGLRSFC